MSASLFANMAKAEVSSGRAPNPKVGKAWYLVNCIASRVGKVSQKAFVSMDMTCAGAVADGQGRGAGDPSFDGEFAATRVSHAIFSGTYFDKEMKKLVLTAFGIEAKDSDMVAEQAFGSLNGPEGMAWLEKNRAACGWPEGAFAQMSPETKVTIGWAYVVDWMTGGLGGPGFFDGQLILEFEMKVNTKKTNKFIPNPNPAEVATVPFVEEISSYTNVYPVRKVMPSEVRAVLADDQIIRIFGSLEAFNALA